MSILRIFVLLIISLFLLSIIFHINPFVLVSTTIKAKDLSEKALVKSNLRAMDVSVESFAVHNAGKYPKDITDFLSSDRRYSGIEFCGKTDNDYIYKCNFSEDGYSISATSTRNPNIVYTISTGGVLKP